MNILSYRGFVLCSLILWHLCGVQMYANEHTHRLHQSHHDVKSPLQLEQDGIKLMQTGDFAQAVEVFQELIELRPDSFIGYYNLASACSKLEDTEASVNAMSQAITVGFTDLKQIKRDPDLEALRTTQFYKELLENWQAIIEARRQNDLEHLKKLIRRGLVTKTHSLQKYELLSAHDQIATDQAFDELDHLSKWAEKLLFVEPIPLEDEPWVSIVLPDRAGFGKWAISAFGPGVKGSFSSIGGAYEHQKRRLVAQDLGATLRHEFIHVLHWRDMSRLGQVHAPWIQEGLASLVEDYELVGQHVVPVPSWRTNIVKRMLQRNRLPSLEELANEDMASFTSKRPLAKYARARTFMLYLLDQHKLTEFYQRYIETFETDPSGIHAIELVLKNELSQIEKQYRVWLSHLETVAETGDDLAATLGIEIENGQGDGVVVKKLPGDARSRTKLRLGSVITAINGRPTRDLLEFIRVLGEYRPGQTITVHHRRGTVHTKTDVKLLKRK